MGALTLSTMTASELEALSGLLLLKTERLHSTQRPTPQVHENNELEDSDADYMETASAAWVLTRCFQPKIPSLPDDTTPKITTRKNASIPLTVSAVRSAPATVSPPPTIIVESAMQVKRQPRRSVKRQIFEVEELADSDEEWQPEECTRKSKIRRRYTTSSSSSNKENVDEVKITTLDAREEETKSKPGPDMVPIGEGHAKIPARLLHAMDWRASHTTVTRKLLTAVFPRSVLATHSLTGKPSPAFPNKPAKKKLNADLVSDIVQLVVEKCRVPEAVVRTSITTKCADESKMLRSRLDKVPDKWTT